MKATAFAPATIGNVGPGFDVLGLAVEGPGDEVTVELTDGPSEIVEIRGRDAAQLPRAPERNSASIAALAMLARFGSRRGVRVWIDKGVPLAGGMGGSASSSVAGALAARLALRLAGEAPRATGHGAPSQAVSPGPRVLDTVDARGAVAAVAEPAGPAPDLETAELMQAALAGEAAVAGRHLDNIAPCVLGGLALVRSVAPIDVVAVPVKADWWVALVTPAIRIETRAARAVLAESWETRGWVGQMANTAALVWAFASGDAALAGRALVDEFAEPRRARLIPRFPEVKRAALEAGALACTISGAGPTVFALAADRASAQAAGEAMWAAFNDTAATLHVGPIARQGARQR